MRTLDPVSVRDDNQCMPVTDADRLHFALIAEGMACKKGEQRLDALRSTPAERVTIGFLLGAVPRDAAVEAALDERAAGQIGLARRRPRPR